MDCLECDVEEDCLGFLNGIPGSNRKMLKLVVNGKAVEFELVTGACCTYMSKEMFKKIFSKKTPSLKFRRNLKTITGEIVQVLGKCKVEVRFQDKVFNLEMVVMDTKVYAPLIGRDWIDVMFKGWRDTFQVVGSLRNEQEILSK